MKVLISSDWHLSDNPRDSYRLKILEKTIPALIEKHEVDILCYLGDICESKDNHSAELANTVVKLFHRLAQLCPIVFLQANHDWLTSPSNPYFRFLEKVGPIAWVQEPSWLDCLPVLKKTIPSRDLAKLGAVLLLPHTANPERDWKALDFSEADLVLAHQTFAQAAGDNGFKLAGVSLSFFPKGLPIISGDVHKPQELGPVTYVGAPYTVDFGDDYEGRVLLLDETGLVSIPVKGPQKRLVEVRSLQQLKKLNVNADDILRVRFVGVVPGEGGALAAEARAWGKAAGVAIDSVQALSPQKASAPRATTPQKTDQELLETYAQARGVGKATLAAGKRLL